jgi:hypothetical protein
MEEDAVIVNIAKDFQPVPGGRFPWEGPNSGEEFREKCLRAKYDAARKLNVPLIVELDGTSGYASSFLEEAFGGLVRKRYADKADLLKRLRIVSKVQPKWVTRIERYVRTAEPE